MKKVLLLGDSIRLGYQPDVTKLLEGKAIVTGPQDNCRFSAYTLWHAFQWVAEAGEVDIIHWNNGIWDMYTHLQDGERFVTPEEYGRNIARTLKELRALCPKARILFATTTPVADANALITNESIDCINDIARRIMSEEHIEVDDLNLALRGQPELICEDNLHLTAQGYLKAAETVVKALTPYLT